jgi:hypothetical protein
MKIMYKYLILNTNIIKYYYRYLIKLLNYKYINLYFYISYDPSTGIKRTEILFKTICIICFFFTNNPDLSLDFLYIFTNNYLDLTQDNIFVNINPSSGNNNNNPFGIGSSNTGNSGPSNPNPNPNPLPGLQPGHDDENYRKRLQEWSNEPIESVFSLRNDNNLTGRHFIKRLVDPSSSEPSNKRIRIDNQPEYNAIINQNINEQQNQVNNKVPIQRNKSTNFSFIEGTKKPRVPHFTNKVKVDGPKFFYFDVEKNMAVYPESLHLNEPRLYFKGTLRVYPENGLTYTYHCESKNQSKHYCKITYPDNTTCDIYDKPTLYKNILLHRDNIKTGHEMKPKFDYNKHYVDDLGTYQKNTVERLSSEFSKRNSTRKIQPNSIPKNIEDKVNKVALNDNYYSKILPKEKEIKKKHLFADSNE